MYLFLVLYNTVYLFFVTMYLCFGTQYFDTHFNFGKYENKSINLIFKRITRNSIQFLGELL